MPTTAGMSVMIRGGPVSRKGVTSNPGKGLLEESRLQLTDLQTFVRVAQAGSFSDAAHLSGLSQPGVSLRISRLEERLGMRLFHRKKPLQLTDPGLRLFNRARNAILHFENVLASIEELKTGEGGLVRLGFSVPQVAMPILRRFTDRHPQVALKLQQRNSHTLLSEVRDLELDVAIVTLMTPEPPEVDLVPLFDQRLAVLFNPREVEMPEGPVRVEDLVRHRVVVQKQPSMTRSAIDKTFLAHALPIHSFFEAPRREAVIEAAAAGLGLGLLFQAEIPPDRRLESRPLALDTVGVRVYAAVAEGARSIPAVALFLEAATA